MFRESAQYNKKSFTFTIFFSLWRKIYIDVASGEQNSFKECVITTLFCIVIIMDYQINSSNKKLIIPRTYTAVISYLVRKMSGA